MDEIKNTALLGDVDECQVVECDWDCELCSRHTHKGAFMQDAEGEMSWVCPRCYEIAKPFLNDLFQW